MTAGSEVVEDYSHIGLSLRRHPVAFLRADLKTRRVTTCAETMQARDGRWLDAAVAGGTEVGNGHALDRRLR